MSYLKQDRFRACDEELWLALGHIVESGQREIHQMERDDILQATFFSECLDFAGKKKAERLAYRNEWFERSLATMQGHDVVCVDPDNGLVVPSAAGGPRENKYVLPAELTSYYAQGSTVVYYQHKARRKDPFYIQQHNELLKSPDFAGASGLVLKFKTTSQRYYLFLVQPQHKATVEAAVEHMFASAWGEHFCLL